MLFVQKVAKRSMTVKSQVKKSNRLEEIVEESLELTKIKTFNKSELDTQGVSEEMETEVDSLLDGKHLSEQRDFIFSQPVLEVEGILIFNCFGVCFGFLLLIPSLKKMKIIPFQNSLMQSLAYQFQENMFFSKKK